MNSMCDPNRAWTEAAIRFAQAGGEVVMRYFRRDVSIRDKGVGNLVSAADVESEKTIAAMIEEAFPGHAILAEENHSATQAAESLWIVDPLDGTNNFAHRIAHFAVSVAFYRHGRAECGVVFNPARNDLFVAQRNGGATRNGQKIRVSQEAALDQALVATGFYYDRGEKMRKTLQAMETLFDRKVHGIRRFGTASLDLCGVAAGEFGAYFEYLLSPWDFAAGQLIVEEAGGTVTDCLGQSLGISASSMLASNGKLHPVMQDIAREIA